DLPATGVALHDDRERPARRGAALPLEDEARGHEREGAGERPHGEILEVQAVPLGTGRKAGRVPGADPVVAVAHRSTGQVRRGAVVGVVGHESLEVAGVPVAGGAGELGLDLAGERGAVRQRGRGGAGIGRLAACGRAEQQASGKQVPAEGHRDSPERRYASLDVKMARRCGAATKSVRYGFPTLVREARRLSRAVARTSRATAVIASATPAPPGCALLRGPATGGRPGRFLRRLARRLLCRLTHRLLDRLTCGLCCGALRGLLR